MGNSAVIAERLKTKFFFSNTLANGETVDDTANKWLNNRRNVEVIDVLYRYESPVSRHEGISYVGIVYRIK